METSQLICSANQLTGLYTMGALVVKLLNGKIIWLRIWKTNGNQKISSNFLPHLILAWKIRCKDKSINCDYTEIIVLREVKILLDYSRDYDFKPVT